MQYDIPKDCQIESLFQIYTHFFPNKTDGFFVEVGANDGVTVSNSLPLVKAGWGGIYIEPVSYIYKKLVENHGSNPKLKLLNCAVGREDSELEINAMGLISTLNPAMVPVYQSISWSQAEAATLTKEIVKVRPLQKILNEQGVTKIDILIVDVEGYELNVLQSLDFFKIKPRMIIIELEDEHPSFCNRPDCQELMDSIRSCRRLIDYYGYSLVWKNCVNSVYWLY